MARDVAFIGELAKLDDTDDGSVRIQGRLRATVEGTGERITPDAIREATSYFMFHGVGPVRDGNAAAGSIHKVSTDPTTGDILVRGELVDPIAVDKARRGQYTGMRLVGRVRERDPRDNRVITKFDWNLLTLTNKPTGRDFEMTLQKADVAIPLGQKSGIMEQPPQDFIFSKRYQWLTGGDDQRETIAPQTIEFTA